MTEAEWKALPWGKGVRVLSSGQDWVAVEKPAGILSHPNGPKDNNRSLLKMPWKPEEEVYGEEGSLEIGLCHRLDAPTSGILLLALPAGVDWFAKAFEDGRVKKTYLAVGVGRPRNRSFAWKDRLVRGREEGKVRVRVGGNGVQAQTDGRELEFRRDPLPLTLLELKPHTGRTHQIRVQAAKHGLPILGDRNYGDFGANRIFQRAKGSQNLFRHAAELVWKREGRDIKVVSKPPEDFGKLFPAFGKAVLRKR